MSVADVLMPLHNSTTTPASATKRRNLVRKRTFSMARERGSRACVDFQVNPPLGSSMSRGRGAGGGDLADHGAPPCCRPYPQRLMCREINEDHAALPSYPWLVGGTWDCKFEMTGKMLRLGSRRTDCPLISSGRDWGCASETDSLRKPFNASLFLLRVPSHTYNPSPRFYHFMEDCLRYQGTRSSSGHVALRVPTS